MKIKTVEYTGSFGFPGGFPADPRPEVALFGRSNVGKSSLINTLLGREGVARISKTPGKTRAANFFRINDRFFLVDMPGYGYAKIPRSESRRFTRMFELYLAEPRKNALVQLIDARHEPTDLDVESVRRLDATGRPMCLVFTKADKVSKSSMSGRISAAIRELDVRPDTGVVAFSSVTGNGRKELWAWIEASFAL
ncbi:MAG: ribosome biogenesis GTP-binding protein YihA/YsxC [Candidatus Krumholzibacteria bacterium]|nr:ribosome biogenesis GTP-binding protein YihA/YsxC [Candidatus Krumholzibacteria bacterium]MDH4336166.1 ribosome biogenesis GTP-binding protein YihA/YsxC [Candidatus Krumholzibacteria bacterium]MDH5268807.1 ribosome biogenesis GTP-binding protein YihA/YsxC [Candidatus Krumholzibacteria bacterium]